MAMRKLVPDAAKRLGVVFGHQRFIYSSAPGPYLKKQRSSLFSKEFGSETRNFRCSPSHLYAAAPSRTSPVSVPADSSVKRSSSKKKGKSSSDIPKIKECPVIFECQECEALCLKRVQQEHFEKGVVVVRCLECRSVNLVADNLGLFKEKDSMQKFLSERGVDLRYGAEGSYELLAEDLVRMVELDEQTAQVQQQQQEEQPLEQQQQEATYTTV